MSECKHTSDLESATYKIINVASGTALSISGTTIVGSTYADQSTQRWTLNIHGGDHKVYSWISDNGSYAGLAHPDQLDGGYKPQTRLIPTSTTFIWNIVEHSEGVFRLQATNTEFYATLADNGSVVDGTAVWLQYKQAHHPQLWKLYKIE